MAVVIVASPPWQEMKMPWRTTTVLLAVKVCSRDYDGGNVDEDINT